MSNTRKHPETSALPFILNFTYPLLSTGTVSVDIRVGGEEIHAEDGIEERSLLLLGLLGSQAGGRSPSEGRCESSRDGEQSKQESKDLHCQIQKIENYLSKHVCGVLVLMDTLFNILANTTGRLCSWVRNRNSETVGHSLHSWHYGG